MSKAEELGDSASFNRVRQPRSRRGREIDLATGGAGGDEGRADAGPAGAPRILPLADIAQNPENPRATLEALQETADSLLERGQIQPITVISRETFLLAHPGLEDELGSASYVVLDGNRRLAAARLAGLDELRVDVNDGLAGSAADLLESAFVANVQREDLTPLEEARALAALTDMHGSLRAVARRVGKSHTWVSQRLALLDLTPELQRELVAQELTVEEARALGKVPQARQAVEAEKLKEARATRPPKVKPTTPGGGNGVYTKTGGKPGGNGVATAIDWEDIPGLADLIRANLSTTRFRTLVGLLVSSGPIE